MFNPTSRRVAIGVLLGLALPCGTSRLSHASAASPADQQLSLAASGAVKILVRGTGWVRVGQPALMAAGLGADVAPASLQLFADGVEQALAVTGNGDGRFTADEAIEFYGVGRDTPWTDVRTYWLVAGSSGARVAVQAAPAPETLGPGSFPYTQTLVGRSLYLSAVLNGDRSNFFGAAVSSTPVTTSVTVPNPDPAAASAATISVALQGVTATAHTVDVTLNGSVLGTCTLAMQQRAVCSFPATGLAAGANSVTLAAHDATDYTATESISVTYAHLYAADGDTLAFTAVDGSRVDVGGFTRGDVRVVDVTDPANPLELVTSIAGTAGAFHAVVDVPAGLSPRALFAFTGAQVLAPVAVQADTPSRWSDPLDGELLILSNAAFIDALAPLIARRQADGWSVQLADLADVYDERGFGDKSASAIRDFIQAARAAWRVPPRFVLLVGDATFDPRNFLGLGDYDFAPTRLIDTASMETASDDWFVDADLDGIPEIAIGRWPVRTAAQAAALVAKTVGYAGLADAGQGGLFVSDTDDLDLNFTGASAQAAAQVTSRMPVTMFHRSDPGATEATLVDKLNAGPFLVNYLGHGSVQVWDGLLDDTAAAALTNAHPSIYVVMNCLNGFFHDLYTTSLAETLLEAPGGAVAVWASSTLADFDQQPTLDQEFLMGIGPKSLGEAAVAAKRGITDLDARRTWLLFGDPTLLGSPASRGDGGATDAGPPRDAGSPDTGGPGAGGASPDGGARDASGPDGTVGAAGAGGAPGALDAAADAGHPPAGGGGGCDCSMDSDAAGSGEAAGLLLLGVMAARARRPRGSRRSRSPWTRRGLAGLVLALGLAAGTRAHAAYGFRMDITLQRTQVGNSGTSTTTLSNYPLLLDITSANLKTTGNGGNVQNASGFDIIFVAEDATTCGGTAPCNLSFELESYTATTGHVIAWVNIPVLNTTSATSNQTIVVEYGNAAISTFQGGANGAAWNSNFKGVWHMTQAASIADSTTTGATATATGTNTSGAVTGLVNKAFSTTSTTGTGHLNYLNTAFNAAAAGTSTYEGWFKTTDSFGPLLSQRSSNGNSVIDIMLGYDGATTASAKIDVLIRDDNNGTNAEVTGTTALNDGNWHQFAVTRSSGTIAVYVDGAFVNSATNTGASSSITSDTAGAGFQSIGLEGDWVASAYTTAENEYLAAIFDEYRITNSAQSSDWIVTDYNTIKTPASTYVLGSQVATSCGNGSRTGTEACDDGNLVSGDGCSSSCTIETGYTCSGSLFAKSTCSTTCGDGITAGSEACDTGASNGTGGCSSSCTVVSGYHCTTASPSVCALATFAYTKTVYVDHTKVGTASAPTTLTNYPMLFSVTDTSLRTVANGGRVQNANGYDIVFRGADTTTCGGVSVCTLSHEVEKYDATTGQLIAWINIPGLKTQTNTAHTQFGILFGNTYITTSTERVTSTWNSAFSGVWHLNQNPGGTAPQMLDSTSNSNDGTNAGALTATGEVGTGVSTNGSSSYISFGSGASLNVGSGNDFTYSVWLNTSASYGGIFSLRSSTSGNPVVDIMVGFDGISTSAGALLALTRDDNGAGLGDVIEGSTSISNGAWHLVTVTRSGTTLQLYDNTTSAGTATVTSAAISSDTRDLGTEGRWVQDGVNSGKQYLAATYDELRVSTTARSLDWITTDYNSQSSPSTFIIYTTGTAGEVATTSHTEAAIVSLQATDNCPGTTVAWQTGYEVDALGFNVYRDLGGQRVRLNTSMLPARGLTAGGSGYSYQLVDDASADPSRTYWIEEVRLNLDTDLTGPVAPAPGPACATTPPMTLGPTGGAAGGPTPVVDTSPAGEADQMGGCAVAGGGPAWGLGPAAIVLLLAFWPRRARSLRKFSSRPQGE